MSLTACHSIFGKDSDNDKNKVEGKRVSILDTSKKPTADKGINDYKIELPAPVANKNWPQAGGYTEHSGLHPTLAAVPKEIWRVAIGNGSNADYKLLARPVVYGDKVFVMDAHGSVSAYHVKNGDKAWQVDTTPKDRDDDAMGGGIGIASDILYATTGFGEVLALKTSDGSVIWRKTLAKPIRAAPTIADDKVLVVSIDNELDALSTKNGEILWHHNGIVENATLMGASNPAATDDSVVVAYSSGEIFSLRAQNGRTAWTDVLAAPAQVGALPAIADIRGLPVIDHDKVFAISHSGRMAAIEQRTGERVWEADIGGINTPAVSGNAVFVLSNDNALVALTRDSGRIIWIKELQKLEDPSDHDSKPVFWWGPVLAGGQLWLTNSLGHIAAFTPTDGTAKTDIDATGAFFISPIIANSTMFVVTDGGELTAFH